jgi:enamine deaminase RidA (YjgF/YER057c/UK114 family)
METHSLKEAGASVRNRTAPQSSARDTVAHQRFSSDWPNEAWAGYSRAVRAGNLVWISGSTATEGDRVLALGDMYEQSRLILLKIKRFLELAGSRLDHVVQTRAYLTDMQRVTDFARAHREAFADVRPVNTTVEVTALARPEMLVEIEAMAVIPAGQATRPPRAPSRARTRAPRSGSPRRPGRSGRRTG